MSKAVLWFVHLTKRKNIFYNLGVTLWVGLSAVVLALLPAAALIPNANATQNKLIAYSL
jgi:hypothetical protein